MSDKQQPKPNSKPVNTKIGKAIIGRTMSLRETHITKNYINYILLVGAIISIGFLSPSGIPRAIGTGLFMYIFTFVTHRALTTLKPIIDFITKAGKTIFINNEIIHLVATSTAMSWVLIINYIFHRFTDVKMLDPYTILFWMLMYSSIHVINFMLLKTSDGGGKEITELLKIIMGVKTTGDASNMGHPKVNIIASAGCILTLISIVIAHPALITIPESYLTRIENIVSARIWG